MILLNFYFSQWHQHFGPLLIFFQWTPAGSNKLNQNVNFAPKSKQNLSVKMCTLKTQSCGDCNRLTIHWEKVAICAIFEKSWTSVQCVCIGSSRRWVHFQICVNDWPSSFFCAKCAGHLTSDKIPSFSSFWVRYISGRNFLKVENSCPWLRPYRSEYKAMKQHLKHVVRVIQPRQRNW